MSSSPAVIDHIMKSARLDRVIKRMAMEIGEDLKDRKSILIAGLNQRGFSFGSVLGSHISHALGISVQLIRIDAQSDTPLADADTVEQLLRSDYVLLTDDVLFSGHTMMNAIRKILNVSNPQVMRTAVIIDRGHRKYPIRADFVGLISPTKLKEHVEVEFDANGIPSSVVLLEQ